MHKAFSFNREYDYVRLDGLNRATGRPAHEWDIYILKELIDNALDADEYLWSRDRQQFPSLSIRMEYIAVPPPQCQQLLVRVGNQALFPVEQIQDIFATQWYTSRKAFMKGITRGTLGNALKTLLGIPYALHNRVTDDWKPDLKPLSICCNGKEYLPRYIVDPIAQTIAVECETRVYKPTPGTLISVGLDYFVQEKPRTLAEITQIAEQYHLCNPHVRFHWRVDIGNQVWEKEYSATSGWTNKFSQLAPIQWYSLTNFKDLLGALYRAQGDEKENHRLTVPTIGHYFSGFKGSTLASNQDNTLIVRVIQDLGQNSLTVADIDSPLTKMLYALLSKYSSPFHSSQLGSIGQEHIRATLENVLPLEGKLHYIVAADPDGDPSMPFVIEAAVAHLREGKRQIWTAINFSPTYSDPFQNRWLNAPAQADEQVLGLRGLLDTYNFGENTPAILFIHLICPNIEHNEFSKTEINHLPFKKKVSEVLDKLLIELRQGQEEEEMRLEQTIFRALTTILAEVSEHERFIPEQLLEKLRLQLSNDQAIALWLERPTALSRLQTYISRYQNDNTSINHYLARPPEALLLIPSHPQHYFSIPLAHVSRELLSRHFVNKILFVQNQELEPVIIDNNWLCRMDMALVHNPQGLAYLEEVLFYCTSQMDVPILILQTPDDKGKTLLEQMHGWLKQQYIDSRRVIGLNPAMELQSEFVIQPTKVMPRELENWLLQRFATLGIALKYTPPSSLIRRDIRSRFEQRLREYLQEDIEQHFALTNLIMNLDETFSYTKMMMEAAPDEQLTHHLQQGNHMECYETALEDMVQVFFQNFMNQCGVKVRQTERAWLTEKQGK